MVEAGDHSAARTALEVAAPMVKVVDLVPALALEVDRILKTLQEAGQILVTLQLVDLDLVTLQLVDLLLGIVQAVDRILEMEQEVDLTPRVIQVTGVVMMRPHQRHVLARRWSSDLNSLW